MFDIGFWEVAVIGVIALLVVGPERLPALARTVGLWVGRIRRYVSHVKQDIEREIHAEEMRELINNPGELGGLKDVANETAAAVEDLRRGLDDAARDSERLDDAEQPSEDVAEPPAPRPIPHHAVDEDPFATDSLDQVTPSTPPATQSDTEHTAGEHEDTAEPSGRR